MKTFFLMITMMVSGTVSAQESDTISKTIVGMEKSALERWNNGDPSGFLEISAQEVVYFDPFTAHRLDGLDKLTELYEKIRGKVHVEKYDMIDPKVQSVNNMAVLTYNLVSFAGGAEHKWNCTEVYRLGKDKKWEIIQTHWSFTTPGIK